MNEGFKSIGDLVGHSLKSFNLERKTRERGAITVWSEVVGARIAKAAWAEQIRDGTLFVACRTSTWANELTFMKADIIRKLNRRLGGQYVKDIRFSSRSRGRAEEPRAEEQKRASEKELEDIRLSAEEQKKIEEAACASGSEELAARIRKAITASRKIEKWKRAHGWKECDSCGSLYEDGNTVCPICGK